jgi:hypothetical protein
MDSGSVAGMTGGRIFPGGAFYLLLILDLGYFIY